MYEAVERNDRSTDKWIYTFHRLTDFTTDYNIDICFSRLSMLWKLSSCLSIKKCKQYKMFLPWTRVEFCANRTSPRDLGSIFCNKLWFALDQHVLYVLPEVFKTPEHLIILIKTLFPAHHYTVGIPSTTKQILVQFSPPTYKNIATWCSMPSFVSLVNLDKKSVVSKVQISFCWWWDFCYSWVFCTTMSHVSFWFLMLLGISRKALDDLSPLEKETLLSSLLCRDFIEELGHAPSCWQ